MAKSANGGRHPATAAAAGEAACTTTAVPAGIGGGGVGWAKASKEGSKVPQNYLLVYLCRCRQDQESRVVWVGGGEGGGRSTAATAELPACTTTAVPTGECVCVLNL